MKEITDILNAYGLEWQKNYGFKEFDYKKYQNALLGRLRKLSVEGYEEIKWNDFDAEALQMLFYEAGGELKIVDLGRFLENSGLQNKRYADKLPEAFVKRLRMRLHKTNGTVENIFWGPMTWRDFAEGSSEMKQEEINEFLSMLNEKTKLKLVFDESDKSKIYHRHVWTVAEEVGHDISASGLNQSLQKNLQQAVRAWSQVKIKAYLKRKKTKVTC